MQEIASAQRQGTPLCVIMMNLDGFKRINDAYGHAIGDKVLQAVTKHLQHNLRASDFLARYGGDELTLVLSKTTLLDAQRVADKVRYSVSEFHYLLDGETRITLGISGGIAAYPIHALLLRICCGPPIRRFIAPRIAIGVDFWWPLH